MIFPQEQTHLFKTYLLQNWRLWKNHGYIKCYSSSSSRPVKNPSNSIRYNCHKIYSWSKRPKTTLETKKGYTRLGDNRAVVFSSRHFPNILKNRDHQRNLPTIWKIRFLQTKVCKKVLAHSSLEPPLEYNQHQTTLTNQGLLRLFEPSWELQKYYAVSD